MGMILVALFLAVSSVIPSFPSTQTNQPLEAIVKRDCSYEAVSNKSQMVSTFVSDGADFTTPDPVYNPPKDRTTISNIYQAVYGEKRWVLVKRHVGIERGKVWGGAQNSLAGREMDILAKVRENGEEKWAFIGIGHCEMDFSGGGTGCWDPLTKTVIFVLQEKGSDGSPQRYPQIDDDAAVPASSDSHYWVFNVYISEQLLKTNNGGGDNYGSDDLPCWLTQCLPGNIKFEMAGELAGKIDEWNRPCQNGTPPPQMTTSITPRPTAPLGQSLGKAEDYPPSFIRTDPYNSWIENIPTSVTIPRSDESLPSYVWFAGKTDAPGSQSYGTFKGRLGNKEVQFAVSLKRLGTAPTQDIGVVLEYGGNYYLYLPTSFSDAKQGENLKLRTFSPGIGYVYEWWYPSCKPVIYLYPETETEFNVSLRPLGIITKSIPHYPLLTGWRKVLARKNGELTYQGQNYESLYYEGKTFWVKVPKEGFLVKGAELSGFFDAILPDLGLLPKEINDFKDYWLDRLSDKEAYYHLYILPREEIDRVEEMEITPRPDSLIRVRLFIKKAETRELPPLPVLPPKPVRQGTTVVDWGGFYKN